MELCNLMEDKVSYITEQLLEREKDVCDCDKCKLDIIAIALNNLPTKYVVTEKGKLLGRANNLNYQFEADIVTEVTKAIEIVKKEPRHL